MSPVRITYFAHGSTEDKTNGIASGWSDVALSETGRTQCAELRRQVRARSFDAVFCSDLRRSLESARIVFPNARILVDDRLKECNYGDLTGSPTTEIEEICWRQIDEPFPFGESLRDVEGRVASFLAHLAADHADEAVAIVGHRVPQLALEVLLKRKTWPQAIDEDWRLKQPPAWKPGWEYRLTVAP